MLEPWQQYHTSNNTGVCGGTNDTKRAIEMLAVMRAFAASRTAA
jgi:hypothetical protein